MVAGIIVTFKFVTLLLISLFQMVLHPTPSAPPADGISISKQYPYYWQYKGEPVLLIGGSDDDNLFQWKYEDKRNHLDLLKAVGGNYIRNTMSDRLDAERYEEAHFAFKQLPDGKYDLTIKNEIYWDRFVELLELCKERDIIVQLEIWDRFDIKGPNWLTHPWRPANNVNYTAEETGFSNDAPKDQHTLFPVVIPGNPEYEAADAKTKKKYDLIRSYQEQYVENILAISLQYDNVLYAMNNETHVHPSWGQYWMSFIREKAREIDRQVLCTDMMDYIWRAEDDTRVLPIYRNNRELYDYAEISQMNSRHLGQTHWDKTTYVINKLREKNYLTHMTKLYGNDGIKSQFVPGDADNAVEEWWQNLIAGVAGQRFHRPPYGFGLMPKAIACIMATRVIEEQVKFWEVEPHMELLRMKAENEAYLAAKPGEKYILYFTNDNGGGASVELDLREYKNVDFRMSWVNIQTAEAGPVIGISGGERVIIDRPAEGHWVAAIVKE